MSTNTPEQPASAPDQPLVLEEILASLENLTQTVGRQQAAIRDLVQRVDQLER